MSDEYYKKVFSKNLKHYMDLAGKSQIDIINNLGYDKSAVSTWCNGSRLPRMDKVDALAKYLGIRRSDLIEEHSEPLPAPPSSFLSADEEALLADFRNLNKQGKEKAAEYISDLAGNEKYIKDITGMSMNVG